MDLPTNAVIPLEPFNREFAGDLAACIKDVGLGRVHLFGWSLGGFIALEFAAEYPELVENVVVCGVRRRYSSEQIEATRTGVLENRERFLKSFYKSCFLPAQKDDFLHFKRDLMPTYLEDMDERALLDSLDLLSECEIAAERLPSCQICAIHGQHDIVAPVSEMISISDASNVELHIIPNAGHAAFLSPDSKTIAERWLCRDRT